MSFAGSEVSTGWATEYWCETLSPVLGRQLPGWQSSQVRRDAAGRHK